MQTLISYPFSKKLLSFLLLSSLPFSSNARTWTNLEGVEIEADYIKSDEFNVTLQMANGKIYELPLSKLSEADNEFVRSGEAGASDSSGNDKEEAGGDVESLNWNDEWPTRVKFTEKAEIIIDSEDAETNTFIYSSQNYRFTSDVRLAKSVVDSFVDLFEATRIYCRTLPLAIDGGVKRNGKYDILLFETKEAYVKAGGPPSSAGVFMGGKNIVMVPLSGLGVQKVGSGYMRDRDKSNKTLPHELTHQLTPSPYYRSGFVGWFTEGIAEYVGITPYRNGSFNVRSNLDDIVEYASAYGKDGTGGRAMGKEFTAPHLADFMTMSYRDFTRNNANFNYGLGLLITTYFFHFDGEGDAALIKKALQKVRESPRNANPQIYLDILLNGRTFEELQDEIYKAWRGKGIKINFAPRDNDKKSY